MAYPRQEKKRKQFLQLAAAGVEYNVIAKALNIARSVLFQWRNEYGLVRRPRGGVR